MQARKRNARDQRPPRRPPGQPTEGRRAEGARPRHSEPHPRQSEESSPRGGRRGNSRSSGRSTSIWLWGAHAVQAALDNPRRYISRLLVTSEAESRLKGSSANRPVAENVTPAALAALLPAGSVHQGLAALVKPLEVLDLSEVCEPAKGVRSVVLVLDQVTDPRNVGAILRSAAAFGVQAVVCTEAHAPPESGVLAKAASGALERVPFVRVSNLARALGTLAELGYWRVGLDSGATEVLRAENHTGAVALVLGAEGTGMRRLTAEQCDFRAKLATNAVTGATGSLNVSVAASVALYELARPAK